MAIAADDLLAKVIVLFILFRDVLIGDEAFFAADHVDVALELHHIIEVVLNQTLCVFLLAVVQIEVVPDGLVCLLRVVVGIGCQEVRQLFLGFPRDILQQKLRLRDISISQEAIVNLFAVLSDQK